MLGLQLDNLKTVNTIDWISYTREHGAYVFNDWPSPAEGAQAQRGGLLRRR
jgi:hypothetical protein